jgi:general L-amino acid transport system permease protein
MFDRLYDAKFRGIVLQVLLMVALCTLFYVIASNTAANLARQNVTSGFGFLSRTSGFDISQKLIGYENTSTFGRAFWVGLCNTLLIASIGIVLATLLGFVMGLARLSSNWLVARLATVYVEIIRNVPLLLQLLFWYFAVLRSLPMPLESIDLWGDVFLNRRGFYFPSPFDGTIPHLGRFNIEGGTVILPEFAALLVGLVVYTAAFIAEIVRSGILGVPKGQREAAAALGLSSAQTLRLVVIPQALRIIIPPLTNQYLNLTKNSSLAVAIGYPDLVSVFSGTVLNLSNQAVEVILITMAVYLTLSLLTSLAMNTLNARMALVER